MTRRETARQVKTGAAAQAGEEHASLPGPGWQALILRVTGAGLLIATGAIHLGLYLTGYRTVSTIGWLFLLQVIGAFSLALAVLATGGRPGITGRAAAPAGAIFALAPLGGYLLSVQTGLFGFHEVAATAGTAAGVIEVAAFAVLAALTLALIRAGTAAIIRAVAPAAGGADGHAAGAARGGRHRDQLSPPANAGTGGDLKTTTIGGARILTNARGFTVYFFAADTPAGSRCYGSCAAYWPPVTGTAPADPGLPGRIGTITRTGGGARQLTYDGTRCTPISVTPSRVRPGATTST